MRVDSNLPAHILTHPGVTARKQPFWVTSESGPALDSTDARALLGQAWESVLGGPAPARGVELLTAQWALETDSGRSMHGHNFGGIKAAASAPGASFRTVEGHGLARREVTARFRVYDSAERGAHDYVRLLAERYPAALAAARAGNVSGFADALARGGYFTADAQAYKRGLEQRLAELRGTPAPVVRAPAWLLESALSGLLRSLCRAPEEA